MNRRCYRWLMPWLGLAALIGGCASNQAVETDAVNGKIVVGANLNPNAAGQASPVFLRIYLLTAKSVFENASYAELADHDQTVLGTSLLSRDELELCPIEPPATPRSAQTSRCQRKERDLTLEIPSNARFLAVMAEFYDLQDPAGSWRAVAAVPRSGVLGFFSSRTFVISLQRATVSVRFE